MPLLILKIAQQRLILGCLQRLTVFIQPSIGSARTLLVYMPHIFQDTHYVFDEEPLLQRLPRTVRRTFDQICQSFKHYLLNNYGTVENRTVILDGAYLVPSTKGQNKKRLGRKIIPSLHNSLTVKKVTFFYINITNKHFLKCLGPNCQLLVLA